MVIENFILHATHCSGDEPNANEPIDITPNQLYAMAKTYIAEDHVDGVAADTDHLKLEYDKVNARVILEDDVDVAFYLETAIDDSIVETVIEMYNNGKTNDAIKAFLYEANCDEGTKLDIISGISLLIGKYK